MYVNDISIYIEDSEKGHMEDMRWVLNLPKTNGLFANLKKCRFHKNKVRFLGYVVSSQSIWIKDERIKIVKNWLEPKSIQDIQVFIGFANFYQQFIQGFSKIAVSLTSMLKTIRLLDLTLRELVANDNEVIRSGSKVDNRNLSKSKKSKNVKSGIQTLVGAMEESTFLTSGTKEVFN